MCVVETGGQDVLCVMGTDWPADVVPGFLPSGFASSALNP